MRQKIYVYIVLGVGLTFFRGISAIELSTAPICDQSVAGHAVPIHLSPSFRNGAYGVPSFGSLLRLSKAQKVLYRERCSWLSQHDFVKKPGLYIAPSFYKTAKGRAELEQVAQSFIEISKNYSEIVFIGRSGTGLLAYLRGRLLNRGTVLRDIPFSGGIGSYEQFTREQITGLRNHFSVNGLSPENLTYRTKPVLLVDFVYLAKGALQLMKHIHSWANELGVGPEVRSHLHFYGIYSAEILAYMNLSHIEMASAKELRRRPNLNSPEFTCAVEEAAERWALPRSEEFLKYVAKVHDQKVSRDFYVYAGHQGPTTQESFTPDKWALPFNRRKVLSFNGQADNLAFIELFYLFEEGRKAK